MAIDPELLTAMRALMREELATALAPHAQSSRVPSMTVAEFAFVVRLSTEVVRRKIRTRSISRDHVSKKAKSFRIKPDALAPFGVSSEEAAARLAEFRLQQSKPKTPA